MPRRGRPPAPQDQVSRAYELYNAEGCSTAKAIAAYLQSEFENPISVRTVSDLLRKFRQKDEETRLQDAPFEWHRIEEYRRTFGLPWGALPLIQQMFFHLWEGHFDRYYYDGDYASRSPTLRQVLWWWRGHLAFPNSNLLTIFSNARHFASRETSEHLFRVPLDFSDIFAWYAYHDSGSDEQGHLYDKAVNEGRIPPIGDWEQRVAFGDDYEPWHVFLKDVGPPQ